VRIVKINDRLIGDGNPCFIIAEAGCNHNQSIEIARKLVDSAVASGADAVKFQTYKSEKLYSRKTPMMEHFRKRMGLSEDATMFDLIKMTELPFDMHQEIVEYCYGQNIPFMSTPFDEESVEFLENFNVPAYKIASFEMTHYPLIKKVAECNKPVVISTGMSSLGDIEQAVSVISKAGNDQIILLHCVSNYPARAEDCNLRVIETMKRAFGFPVGISDHTPGVDVAKIAVAVGANLIEKHITIDQTLPGPDHYFSLTPSELKELVSGARDVEVMLGSPHKQCTDAEQPMKHIGRRSLVAAVAIRKGEKIDKKNIAIKRPGYGIHPMLLDDLVGCCAVRDIEEDEPLAWDMFLTQQC